MHNTAADQKRLFNYIKNHTQDEWFVKSYGGFLFPFFTQGYLGVIMAGAFSKIAMPHGLAFQNWINDREFNWHWNTREMLKTRHQLFSALERDQNFGKKFYNEYLKGWRRFVTAAEKKQRLDLDKITPEQIVKHLLELISAAEYQAQGYIVDSLLSVSEDDWFKKQIVKYLDCELSTEELNDLREPTHRSFINNAHLLTLQAACARKQKEKFNRLLKNLVKRYFWISTNYLNGGQKTSGQFLKEIDQIKNPCVQNKKEIQRIKKNGNMVEVDANRGIIKIFKRA